MMFSPYVCALTCVFSSGFVAASQPLSLMDVTVKARNAPGTTDDDTFQAISRALSTVRFGGRDTGVQKLQNHTSIEKVWDDGEVLFFLAGTEGVSAEETSTTASVEIVCSTCYIKGDVVAHFTVNTSALQHFEASIKSNVLNIVDTAFEEIKNYTERIASDVFENGTFEGLPAFPTVHLDPTLDNATVIPECQLQFQFSGLELYIATDIKLSSNATYTLNLYSSESPLGFSIGQELQIGVIFAIDLILDVKAEIDLASGFHIKLDDGFAIDITMFEKDVSSITFPGGQFEFLPVMIEGTGSLTAVLRLGIHSGLEVNTDALKVLGVGDLSFSAGVEVGIFANIAELVTRVTESAEGDTSGCELQVVEEYTLAIGAAAGATVGAALVHELFTWGGEWGPQPETTIPIWYTTLGSSCLSQKASTPTSSTVTVAARAEIEATSMTTTAVTKVVTYTAVGCMALGSINCPASLQTTSTYESTLTTVLTVSPGSVAIYPASIFKSVLTPISFGSNAQLLTASTGMPISYIPLPPIAKPTTGSMGSSGIEGVNKRLTIGLTLGLGVPVLVAIIIGCIYLIKRKKYSAVVTNETETHNIHQSLEARQPRFMTPDPHKFGNNRGKESYRVDVTEIN